MQPNQPTSHNGFTPKWRHFHPMDRIWVQNPFDHDVRFKVADEFNRTFWYTMQAHRVAELPGGSIATLGVKAIVDELIQSTKGEEMHMWTPEVRLRHENDIILREKHATVATSTDRPGEVNLTVNDNDEMAAEAAELAPPATPEVSFPGLNARPRRSRPTPIESRLSPLPGGAQAGLNDVIAASLPSTNAVVSANNAHDGVEG